MTAPDTAVDTNILIRLLTEDDPLQAQAARRLFARESVWIGRTVLLETGWVLRSLYGFDGAAIWNALSKLVRLKSVQVENEAAVLAAIELTTHCIELADAMHLTGRPAPRLFHLIRRSCGVPYVRASPMSWSSPLKSASGSAPESASRSAAAR